MSRTPSVQFGKLVAVCALALQTLSAGTADAQCFVQPLNSGQTFTVTANPSLYSFTPSAGHWGAIGIRSQPGNNWLLELFGNWFPFPPCVAGSITATSGGPGRVNFVVGDFRVLPPQTYYTRAFGPASPPGFLEFDATRGDLLLNDQITTVATGTSDVVHVWDSALSAGQIYRIHFAATPGVNARVLVFGNTGGSPWQDRSAALIESATSFDFSPPTTDSYAIVVVNDNGGSGSYSISIGQCNTPVTLVGGVSQSAPTGYGFYQFRAGAYPSWETVAIRGGGGGTSAYQLDVAAGPSGGTFPDCFFGNLVTSNEIATNLIVGDFHFNPGSRYYVETSRLTLATGGGPPTIDLDDNPSGIIVNGPPETASTDASDVVQIWDVYLTAGQDVDFSLTHSGPAALKMLLFRPTGSILWLARSAAEFVTTSTMTYTVPASGYYGLAVLNENGATDVMTIQANSCHAPVVLANNVAVSTSLAQGEFYEFNQTAFTWVAFGARAATDWDVWEYDTGPVNATPDCLYNMRAQSFDHTPTRVDFVVTDFHKNPPGPFFARAFPMSGSSIARVECSAATHTIVSGDPVSIGSVAAGDVLQTWNAIVSSGQSYLIHFLSSAPGYRLAVFRSFTGDYWESGSSAMFEVRHDTTIVAPANLTLGLVVLNDPGVVGGYELGLNPPVTAVAPSTIPSRTELLGITPNPARAASQIEFALHEGGEVAFDVLDVAGRVVARGAPERYPAGRWTVAWSGVAGNAAALHPGLYFVRMRVNGATLSARRVSLIE